jgi:hypothetical protein
MVVGVEERCRELRARALAVAERPQEGFDRGMGSLVHQNI